MSEKLRVDESVLLNKADLILTDTQKQLDLFQNELNVPRKKLYQVYVGAEKNLFMPNKKFKLNNPIEVLFYGSFISLQSTETIIKAAKLLSHDKRIIFTFIGEGPDYKKCINMAKNSSNISFNKNIEYENLPEQINKADILLGIFGKSEKAGSVIPNKVFQSMACGKPVITRKSSAFPRECFSKNSGILFVPPENHLELSKTILNLINFPKKIKVGGVNTKRTFEKLFSEKHIKKQLKIALDSLKIF